ncbi:potassium channel family protein [Microbacterium sp. NPDC076911]|uniref:potassium channel family protein n=1 Tax=Microbacterium sp. NPDC076911 TaxID=3154958 RepID=UPI0034284CF7
MRVSSNTWWAFVTITTVGYGDCFPLTVNGRFVAAGLMVGGIALVRVVTATLASWIVEKVAGRAEVEENAVAATEQQVEALRSEVAELKDMIRALAPAGGSAPDDFSGGSSG